MTRKVFFSSPFSSNIFSAYSSPLSSWCGIEAKVFLLFSSGHRVGQDEEQRRNLSPRRQAFLGVLRRSSGTEETGCDSCKGSWGTPARIEPLARNRRRERRDALLHHASLREKRRKKLRETVSEYIWYISVKTRFGVVGKSMCIYPGGGNRLSNSSTRLHPRLRQGWRNGPARRSGAFLEKVRTCTGASSISCWAYIPVYIREARVYRVLSNACVICPYILYYIVQNSQHPNISNCSSAIHWKGWIQCTIIHINLKFSVKKI
jgi:hypothetical protein